jgi:hypothetical protein
MRSLVCAVVSTICCASAHAFDYFEHRAIANSAMDQALSGVTDQALLADIREAGKVLGVDIVPPGTDAAAYAVRREKRPDFGDGAAVSGDLSDSADELAGILGAWGRAPGHKVSLESAAERIDRATRQQLDSVCRWLYGSGYLPASPNQDVYCLDLLADGNQAASRKSRYAGQGYKPMRAELAQFEKIDKYVSLAANNRTHFPAFSWQTYLQLHHDALEMAACHRTPSAACQKASQGRPALAQALLLEAMAQHYLQDSFAAGHIGSYFGFCGFLDSLFCRPPKSVLQHTHDYLNNIGLDVHINNTALGLPGVASSVEWTAFGDRSYFVPEAAFHRWVVSSTAKASIEEVLAAAGGQASTPRMNDPLRIFPMPPAEQQTQWAIDMEKRGKFDNGTGVLDSLVDIHTDRLLGVETSRPMDWRIPEVPIEGWKFGAAWGLQKDAGDYRGGSAGGVMLRMDYIRSTSDWVPNAYGVESWYIPSRGSTIAGTFGYQKPREVSALTVSPRLRFASRLDESSSGPENFVSRSRTIQLSVVTDVTYTLFGAYSLFFRFEPWGYDLKNHKSFHMFKSPAQNAFGIQIDLTGVL